MRPHCKLHGLNYAATGAALVVLIYNVAQPPVAHGRTRQGWRLQSAAYSMRLNKTVTPLADRVFSSKVGKKLEDRRHHAKQVCQKHGLDKLSAENNINAWEFFINLKYDLVWCNVFKAGSSTWLDNFISLADYYEVDSLDKPNSLIAMARKIYPRPTLAELMATMNQTERPLSFMIARHPLHRLVSGYRDKLLSGKRYYIKLARCIVLRHYQKEDQKHGTVTLAQLTHKNKRRVYKKSVVPTFPQFVEYVIDTYRKEARIDEHWAPMYKFCSPCLFQFDVIAKMETMDEDSFFIINKSGLENLVELKTVNRNREGATEKLAHLFLCKLSRSTMMDLIDLYKYDLDIFNYDSERYVNCTRNNVNLVS